MTEYLKQSRTRQRQRILFVYAMVVLVMIGLAGRLLYLMVNRADYYGEKAKKVHQRQRAVKAARGIIYDRNGTEIASNKPVSTISVIHNQIVEPEKVIEVLSTLLDLPEEKVRKRVEKVSSYLVTEPYGGVEQDDFLNGAMEVRTLLTPEELLAELHRIEAEHGRERVLRWGPRTLDLDIIFYDDLVMDSDELTIPHIDMQNRDFVVDPMAEIAPYKRHPIYGKTMKELKGELHGELIGAAK